MLKLKAKTQFDNPNGVRETKIAKWQYWYVCISGGSPKLCLLFALCTLTRREININLHVTYKSMFNLDKPCQYTISNVFQ